MALSQCKASYSTKSTEVDGRPAYGNTLQNPPPGSLIQDWEYIEGSGDLDYHNGRFCVTPEYPNGTYAYFMTVDPENVDAPTFPYIMGLTTRETIDTTFTTSTVTPPDPGGGGGEAPLFQQYRLRCNHKMQLSMLEKLQPLLFKQRSLQKTDPLDINGRSTDGGFAFAAITGATSNEYQVTGLAYMTGYKYRVRLIGPLGVPLDRRASNSPLDSNPVTLTVAGSGGGGSLQNRFDSTSSTMDSTAQTFDGT